MNGKEQKEQEERLTRLAKYLRIAEYQRGTHKRLLTESDLIKILNEARRLGGDEIQTRFLIQATKAAGKSVFASFWIDRFVLRTLKAAISKRAVIKRPPGTNIVKIADFLCSPKSVEQIFEPLVADWQKEYFDALKDGRRVKARWISVRYYGRAVMAFGLNKLLSFLKGLSSAKK